MHILIIPSERYVSTDTPLGGIFQFHQARALAQSGLQVGVIAPAPLSVRHWPTNWRSTWAGIERERDASFPTYRFQGINWTTGRLPVLYPYAYQWYWERCGRKLFDRYVVMHGKPDLVHAHNCLQAGVFAAHCLAPQGIPLVITEHSSTYSRRGVSGWQAEQVRLALKTAQARLVVTPNLGTVLEEQFGPDARPWDYVPNILDEQFETSEPPIRTAMAARPFCFLHVAALRPIKNQVGLIEAFADAFGGRKDVQLHIGGDGPLGQTLEDIVHSRQIGDQVMFLGHLNRRQVMTAMQQADVFVLSSDYETFGVVLIEAAASGCPLIATSGSGPDAIVHKGNGLLVPPRDVVALADAMRKIHAESERYDPLEIRRDCLSRFGQSAIVGRLKGVYERVLAGTPSEDDSVHRV